MLEKRQKWRQDGQNYSLGVNYAGANRPVTVSTRMYIVMRVRQRLKE